MGASLLVFANKVDIDGCMNDDEIREVSCILHMPRHCAELCLIMASMQGLQLEAIKTHRWTIIRCSAITGQNLKEGLEWVVQDARDRLFLH